jgi:hypothetical protein
MEALRMDNPDTKRKFSDLGVPSIHKFLMFCETQEFLNLLYSCKTVFHYFNENEHVFREYLKIPDFGEEELLALKKWNPNVKKGHYGKPDKRRRELCIINKKKKDLRALKILLYKTDGGQSRDDAMAWASFLENMFLNKIDNGSWFDNLGHFNFNATGVILPFTYRKLRKFLGDMPVKNEENPDLYNFSTKENYGFFNDEIDDKFFKDPSIKSDFQKDLPFYSHLEKNVYIKYRVDKCYPYFMVEKFFIRSSNCFTANTKVYAVWVHNLPLEDYKWLDFMNDKKIISQVLAIENLPLILNKWDKENQPQFVEFEHSAAKGETEEKPRLVCWIDLNSQNKQMSFTLNLKSPVIGRFLTVKLIDTGNNPEYSNMDVFNFWAYGIKIRSDYYRLIA